MPTYTIRDLAHHVSGDEYIIEQCSLWEDEQCVGVRTIAATGPIQRRDLPMGDDGQPSRETYDALDNWQDLTDEDAEWLQAEEDAGRINYPFGARK